MKGRNQKGGETTNTGFYVYDPKGNPTTKEPFKTKKEAEEAKKDYLRGYKGEDADKWKIGDEGNENKKIEEKKKASLAKQEKGFYVYNQNGDPVNRKPFESKKEAAQAMNDYLEGYKRAGGSMEKLWSIEEAGEGKASGGDEPPKKTEIPESIKGAVKNVMLNAAEKTMNNKEMSQKDREAARVIYDKLKGQ